MPFTCYSPFASIESKMSCWEVLCEWELSLKYIAHKIHAKLTPWWFPVVTYVFYRNPCNVSRTSWASHTSENGSVESFAYFFKKKKKTLFEHVYYHMWNESPVQVQCMRQGARGWCTGRPRGMGWRGRWEGGFRMGNICTPVVGSCQCMAKPLQYCN